RMLVARSGNMTRGGNVTNTLLEMRGVVRHFDVSPPWLNRVLEHRARAVVKAVDGVDLTIGKGETLGLVGESGCGKSTVARLIVGLYTPSRGTITYDGVVIAGEGAADSAAQPIRTLEPATTKLELAGKVAALLEQVGLGAADGIKFPHQFSGGQRQRISIARALSTNPSFLVCDETP